jgi:putative protease
MNIGVDVLKVEGRGRSPYYVALTARTYRQAIDDWFENPDSWNPKPYMRELETISGRGYTLAFHDGRLTNYAHSYEGNMSAGEWEYAGIIEEVADDNLIIKVKNKFEAGDVFEFIPAGTDKTFLLRLYEFETTKGQKMEVLHAGDLHSIIIPFSAFDREDPAEVHKLLKPMTVIRKEKSITETERARIDHDRAALRLEQGKGSEKVYAATRDRLQKAIEEENSERRPRSPRMGTEGCCGRGCNGCHIFWNDPSYEKARELLATKKQGEMLDKPTRLRKHK